MRDRERMLQLARRPEMAQQQLQKGAPQPQQAQPGAQSGEAAVLARAMAVLHAEYAAVLAPFLIHMDKELRANADKGGRDGWRSMKPDTALLEIYHHLAKLQRACRNDDGPAILEHSADVANGAMMLLDVFGGLGPVIALHVPNVGAKHQATPHAEPVDGLGIPLSCAGPLCSPSDHLPLCALACRK